MGRETCGCRRVFDDLPCVCVSLRAHTRDPLSPRVARLCYLGSFSARAGRRQAMRWAALYYDFRPFEQNPSRGAGHFDTSDIRREGENRHRGAYAVLGGGREPPRGGRRAPVRSRVESADSTPPRAPATAAAAAAGYLAHACLISSSSSSSREWRVSLALALEPAARPVIRTGSNRASPRTSRSLPEPRPEPVPPTSARLAVSRDAQMSGSQRCRPR
mmetsp:Transcript_1645/g.4423  ORF Transcript_1645/g.4423 Transcript_1645/m.4423 type:complete len:217 (+) Transcript_1645:526-1176(+)